LESGQASHHWQSSLEEWRHTSEGYSQSKNS
jgi:hypothetical protein